jgi:hypothetical protein
MDSVVFPEFAAVSSPEKAPLLEILMTPVDPPPRYICTVPLNEATVPVTMTFWPLATVKTG